MRLKRLILYEFSITEGSAIFMVSFLISAVLGIIRQILLNMQFGASADASAYYAAFRLPETIGTLLMGGTLANAMVPVLLHVSSTEGEAAALRFINLVATMLLTVIFPIVFVCIIIAPWFVTYLLAPGFSAQSSNLTTTLTRLMLLELVPAILISVSAAVLISRNQFVLPSLSIAFHNITLIAGILLAMMIPRFGIYGPTFGTMGDSLFQVIILLPGLYMQGLHYRPVWDWRDKHLWLTIRLLIPNGLSAAVNYAGGIVDTAFASLAHMSGSVPATYNAWLLFGFPIRLLGIAVGQAAFPRLANHAVNESWQSMRRVLIQTVVIALSCSIVAMVGLIFLGRWMIRLVFEHGAFDDMAGTLTADILAVYALAIPATIGTEILTRGLIALYDTRTPLITNCIQLIGRLSIIPLLMPHLDVVAIPLSFAITATLETIILGVVLFVRLHRKMNQESLLLSPS